MGSGSDPDKQLETRLQFNPPIRWVNLNYFDRQQFVSCVIILVSLIISPHLPYKYILIITTSGIPFAPYFSFSFIRVRVLKARTTGMPSVFPITCRKFRSVEKKG